MYSIILKRMATDTRQNIEKFVGAESRYEVKKK